MLAALAHNLLRWTQLLGPSDFGYGGLGVAVGPDQSVVIAGSRGHEGDNAGRSAIERLVTDERGEHASTFVFGCSLL